MNDKDKKIKALLKKVLKLCIEEDILLTYQTIGKHYVSFEYRDSKRYCEKCGEEME